MPKIRIYELAKMLKIENKELIEKLKELGIEAKSHMSVLTEEDADVVMEMFGSNQIQTAEKKQTTAQTAPQQPQEQPVEKQPKQNMKKQENQNDKKGKHKKEKQP